MTKVICDMCDKEISDSNLYRVRMVFQGASCDMVNDFCISCATRIKNKIRSFIAEAKEKEDAYGISF